MSDHPTPTPEPTPRICKHCKFWGRSYSSVCDRIELSEEWDTDPAKILVRVSDDTGLIAHLVTSQEFGCTLFQPSQQ